MSTTENFNVYKGLPYQIRARAVGKYDYTASQTFTTEGQSVNVSMAVYDGLSETYEESWQSADKVDFSNTVLPWKWEYSTALSTNRYCLMPVGTSYENITELDYGYNFNVVGSPTINDETKVVSGFSASNYLKLKEPFNPGNNPWEAVFKIKTGSDVTTGQVFFHSGKSLSDGYGITLNTDTSKFGMNVSFNGSSWGFDLYGTYVVSVNTEYLIKAGWSGTEYYLYYMNITAGETEFTKDITYVSSNAMYSDLFSSHLGCYYASSASYIWQGSIDLSESYIKINGSDWWVPFTKRAKQVLNSNITNTGDVSIDSNFVASGFARYKYLQFQNIFNPGANPWKIVLKVKISSLSTYSMLLGQSKTTADSGRYGMYFQIKADGTIVVNISSNGSSWDIGAIEGSHVYDTNKWYWLKFEYNSTEGYKLSYSEDGVTYYLDGSNSSTTPLYNNLPYTMLGQYNPNNNSNYFLGSMDLSESYFEVNGNIVLSGTNPVTETLAGCTYNFTDDGSATTLNCFAVNGDESVVLTPDNSYTNGWLLGTVSIPSHTVYSYNNGVWTEE